MVLNRYLLQSNPHLLDGLDIPDLATSTGAGLLEIVTAAHRVGSFFRTLNNPDLDAARTTSIRSFRLELSLAVVSLVQRLGVESICNTPHF